MSFSESDIMQDKGHSLHPNVTIKNVDSPHAEIKTIKEEKHDFNTNEDEIEIHEMNVKSEFSERATTECNSDTDLNDDDMEHVSFGPAVQKFEFVECSTSEVKDELIDETYPSSESYPCEFSLENSSSNETDSSRIDSQFLDECSTDTAICDTSEIGNVLSNSAMLNRSEDLVAADDNLKSEDETNGSMNTECDARLTLKQIEDSKYLPTIVPKNYADDFNCVFECRYCGKKFKWRSGLKRHMLTHEPNPNYKRSFTCDLCKKKFFWKSHLERHLISHETDPSLRYLNVCNVCQKGFIWKSHLKTHLLTHEPNFSAKHLFKCTVCKINFAEKSDLIDHRLTHKNGPDSRYSLNCSVCEKKFAQKHNLKIHLLIHERDPNLKYAFECNICQKKFIRKGSLKRHAVTHETDPLLKYSFKCDTCNKRFVQKNSLKKHLLSHKSISDS